MPPRKQDPVKRADEVLQEQGVTAVPVNVEKIAKSRGAVIRFSPLDEELSGMIYLNDEQPIIGVNSLHHPNRQRFSIAHEIGHLVLHGDLLSGKVHVDKEFTVNCLHRDEKSALGNVPIEIQANQFAAALLVPTFFLETVVKESWFDIDDDSPIEELARKLRVSRQVFEFRIRNLK